jgi:hypothetical protein
MKNKIDGDELVGVRFFCTEFNWQVDSVYTNFSKAPSTVNGEDVCGDIEPARYLWLRSCLTRRIQRKRIGDAVSKDICGFRLRPYEAVSSRQGSSRTYKNSVGSE